MTTTDAEPPAEPEKDGAPFPTPWPKETGFSPLDSDNQKEWWKWKREWEAEHGPPLGT